MGRKQKPGISFYRMDCGHIRNKKVRLLCNEFDSDGYYIWKTLLDYGYMTWGYYFDLNDKDELELFATEYCRKKLTLIKEVITGCIRRDLFNKDVADAFGILTCHDMQEVFMYATADRRAKGSVFEMQEDWLIYDFHGKIPGGITIVPGKKKILPGNYSQTETKTKTETKKKMDAQAGPAPPSVVNKKDSEPFWQPLVDTWFSFYQEKFKDPPTFTGRATAEFKQLVQLLKKRSQVKMWEWSEKNSVEAFNKFLGYAYADKWLSTNFTIANLVKQFDSVYQKAKGAKPTAGSTSSNGVAKSFEQTMRYLFERYCEPDFDARLILPEYYDKLVVANQLKPGAMDMHDGTIEERKISAVIGFLEVKKSQLVQV